MTTEPRYVSRREIARLIFFTFLLSFIAARVMVILIMARKVPDLFLHMGDTHVHHLNYGIFLLSTVGAYLLFQRPQGRALKIVAVLYAFALALTFDEFGMWLHLGGSYWQRASFDAVVVIAAMLAMLAFAPSLKRARSLDAWEFAVALLAIAGFFYVWTKSFAYAKDRVVPHLLRMEQSGPR